MSSLTGEGGCASSPQVTTSRDRAEFDLVIRAERAMIAAEGLRPCAVGVRDGRFAAVEPIDAPLDARASLHLADDEVLLPGVVDSHVHVNDPGRTHWEGFASATKAAAAGGVTTIVDMPLNSIPPTTDPAALQEKHRAAAGRTWVDVGFWAGAVPGNRSQLRRLAEAGVSGFKCFLLNSGVEEFPPLDPAELEAAMREIASFDGLLIVHAEAAEHIAGRPHTHSRRYLDYLASRPGRAEAVAVQRTIATAARTGCRVHIVHVSTAETLPLIESARRDGVRISGETCPHYLTFDAETIPDGATEFKCCPPVRDRQNRERLWEGLREGTLDTVVTDHSPTTPELKAHACGDFTSAWGGIASLQVGLPAVWTEARKRGFGLADVSQWMSSSPARLAGLPAKGSIEVGRDADFLLFAPEDSWVVDARLLHHRHAITPYGGRTLTGDIRGTWLRGRRIDVHSKPCGRLLRRGSDA